ncbi:MAG: hypothetical protein DWQ08_10075 [Proteobacteria bacterium]|nr:MAG: hypothetical protein DWQ08_10075 [Pseudomonadota bacterium]
MSGIAGILDFVTGTVARAQIDAMMHLVRHRGPDGIDTAVRDHVAIGQAHLQLDAAQPAPPVAWHPNRRLVAAVDARIYNRPALIKALQAIAWIGPSCSDGALVLAAFEKWGRGLVDELDGEFAFAILDIVAKTVFAARDPFGSRPFFYFHDDRRFVFGSEPKQILCRDDVDTQLNDAVISDFLTIDWSDEKSTFFQDVSRLAAGHYLVASKHSACQHRYWSPDPEKDYGFSRPEEYAGQFGILLRRSLAKRLAVDRPVAAHLSGGFDSTSLVVLADDIYRHDDRGLPRLETISAVYPGLACDESRYIEAANSQVRFANRVFDPRRVDILDGIADELWQIDSPFGNIQRAFFAGAAARVNAIGARVLLDGEGGDELCHEMYYLRDLARRGRFLELVHDSWIGSKTSWNTFAWLLLDGLKSAAPDWLRNAYRLFRPNSRWQPPAWINPEFAKQIIGQPAIPRPGSDLDFPSLTQKAVYMDLANPALHWGLDTLECRGSYFGYESRHPYLDRDLVDLVIATPLDMRRTGGQWRHLQRAALAGLLPAPIRERRRKTRFDEYIEHAARELAPWIGAELLNDGTWLAERYVDKREYETLLHLVRSGAMPRFLDLIPVWRIAFLELWLRRLPRYNSPTG